MKANRLVQNGRFYVALAIFSLTGQIAWVVENMYFNVFLYKLFHAGAAQISLMVGASAIVATLTTWLIGVLSDRVGRRKCFICGGYLLWGISILAFALIREDILKPFAVGITAAKLGIILVILLDCVMTFFGSTANDACFNAWMTDCGDETNRGKIEGLNAMMPLVAILVVFGGFSGFNLDRADSWSQIYIIIGITISAIGLLGFWLIQEPEIKKQKQQGFITHAFYAFRLSVIRKNPLLYAMIGAFALFGISIQIFMPYLILYYEQTLGMKNYVIVLAPAILAAAGITSLYGKNYDQYGFKMSVLPSLALLMSGYVFLFFCTDILMVFIGSLLMMTGYLTGMAVYGAMIRDHIPVNCAGMFQGLRICGQVLIPGVVGPAIGAMVLRNAEIVVNADGTTSFLPDRRIFLAALIAAIVLMFALFLIFYMMRIGHNNLCKDDVDVGWEEYPRPQMKRDSYYSLNGIWKLNGKDIRVPFPPQSYRSGYSSRIGRKLQYVRSFTLPEHFYGKCRDGRVMLHFGAVDQIASVVLNGVELGTHEGGYLPFTYDVTDALQDENTIIVNVLDTLDDSYPYGKQRKRRGGMWYTPVSGIWQSVWLECVPKVYLSNIKITPDLTGIDLELEVGSVVSRGYEDGRRCDDIAGSDVDARSYGDKQCKIQHLDPEYRIEILSDDYTDSDIMDVTGHRNAGRTDLSDNNPDHIKRIIEITGHGDKVRIDIENPHLWTPEDPYLYRMRIQVGQDVVESYFALRVVTIEKIDQVSRICLNHKPIFLNGVLDQGYYCGGIYVPDSEQDYAEDITKMQAIGFNTLRKHIKIEPECFYYDCDRLGMLVMQDMVNNGHYSFFGDTVLPTFGRKVKKDTKAKKVGKKKEKKRRQIFESHMKETIKILYNHPCIIGYTIFNEGWGQFESDAMYEIAKAQDSTRFMDSTSGWYAQEKSDVDSLHIYFKRKDIIESDRPVLLTECGGYAYRVDEHIYSRYTHYGYGNCLDQEQLTSEILALYDEMVVPAIHKGLCGCIYTQLSDVEDETNGLLTYDRNVCKVDQDRLKKYFEDKLKIS